MNVEQTLHQAIIDHPDDDLPRLALADWHEEHGRTGQAELMRTQLALAKVPEGDARRPGLLSRQTWLLARHGKVMGRSVRRLARRWELRRGCVEGATLTPKQFPDRAADLFARVPLRHLRLAAPQAYQSVADCPWLNRIHELSMTAGLSDGCQWGQILRSPYLNQLTALRLHGGWLESSPTRESFRVNQLELFEYRQCGRYCRPMLNEGKMERLRWLILTVWEGDLPLRGLLNQLEGLELRKPFMEQGVLQQLANPFQFGHLRDLRLSTWETSLDVRPLLASGAMSQLHTLDLTACGLTSDAVAALSGGGGPAELIHLDIGSNPLGHPGVELLTHCGLLDGITHLGLARVSSQGRRFPLVRVLIDAPLTYLASLDLRGNQVSGGDALDLALSPLANQLYRLDLRHNELGDAGAEALLRSDWPRLAWLDVRDNGIGGSAKAALRQRFGYTVHY